MTANSKPALVFIGPSGVGKSTIYRYLEKQLPINFIPSWTTRPKRSEEQELEHVFVDSSEFYSLQTKGFFIDSIQPFGLNHKYGLPHIVDIKDQISVVSLRVFALEKLRKHYSNLLVYQIERPFKQAMEAMSERNEETGERAIMFNKEILVGRKESDRIFRNINLESCVAQIVSAVEKDYGI